MKQRNADDSRVAQESGRESDSSPGRVKPGALRNMGQSLLVVLVILSMALSLTPMGAVAQDPTGAETPATETPATETPAVETPVTETPAAEALAISETSTQVSDESASAAAAQSGQGTAVSLIEDEAASSGNTSSSSSSSTSPVSETSSEVVYPTKNPDPAVPVPDENVTPTPTEAPDEEMPASSVSVKDKSSSITVKVEVGAGVFNSGWGVILSPKDADEAASGISNAKVVTALHLQITDANGNNTDLPEGKTAKVTITGANASPGEVLVYSISGSSAERVSTSTATADTQVFSTDTFSPTFAVAVKDTNAEAITELNDSANGVAVEVKASEGALSDDVKMNVTSVDEKSVKDAVESAIGGKTAAIKAVDITFTNAADEVIKPKKAVTVKLSGVSAGENQELYVLHIKDGKAVKVPTVNAGATFATFTSQDFSTYVLAAADKQNTATSTITITADAQSKTYGDDNPELTYKVTGLLNEDTLESIGLAKKYRSRRRLEKSQR